MRSLSFTPLAIIPCLLLLSACDSGTDTPDPLKQTIRPIKYAQVNYVGGDQTRRFNGKLIAADETRLSFRNSGLITKIQVSVGERVKQGQLLALQDKKDVTLNVERAKAKEASSLGELETAKANLERLRRLYQSDSASLSDYERAKSQYTNAQSNYTNAQKSLKLEESKLAYAEITSPLSGVVGSVTAETNEYVNAGDSIIVVYSGSDDLEVEVNLPERYINSVNVGETLEIEVNDSLFTGIVSEVSFSANESASYPVSVKITNPNKQLRPGMPAIVTFQFHAKTAKQLVVPFASVGEENNENFVFLLTASDDQTYEVSKQTIELGPLENLGFQVKSGLQDGDLVATAGLRTLYSGARVKLLLSE